MFTVWDHRIPEWSPGPLELELIDASMSIQAPFLSGPSAHCWLAAATLATTVPSWQTGRRRCQGASPPDARQADGLGLGVIKGIVANRQRGRACVDSRGHEGHTDRAT